MLKVSMKDCMNCEDHVRIHDILEQQWVICNSKHNEGYYKFMDGMVNCPRSIETDMRKKERSKALWVDKPETGFYIENLYLLK